MNRQEWIGRLVKAIDGMDADGLAAFMDEDVVFRFGNAEPVAGRAEVRDAVGGFFQSIAGISHEVSTAWADDEVAVLHGMVTYTRRDGSTLKVPFANILGLRGELISEYLIFVDNSGLFRAGG